MTRQAPRHVNQFSAGGRFPNGDSSTAYDCMVACGVMDLDAGTGGRIVLSTTQLRARQSDNDRTGIGLNDVAEAHRNTPGAPALSYGTKGWPTVARRLQAADGAILAGYYVALGSSRASGFRGPHALYVQRITGGDALINDPLRHGPVWIPASALQRFYLSGIGQAGWSVGAGGAVSTQPPGPVAPAIDVGAVLGEFLATIGRTASDPIRAEDVAPFVRFLQGKGLVPPGSPNVNPLVGSFDASIRALIGKPWSSVGPTLLAQAGTNDPFGLGAAIGQLVAGASEVARNGILLVAILGLVIMGLWLVATATDNPLPAVA